MVSSPAPAAAPSSRDAVPPRPRSSPTPSLFERHRAKTLVAFLLLSVSVLDVALANIMKLVPARAEAPSPAATAYRTRSGTFHHDLRPNVDVDGVAWGRLRYRFATDSLGFRNASPREVPLRSQRRRMLFIGDSFTEGVGYPFEETFVGILADELGRQGVEVLNAGVVSYAPSICYAKVRSLLQRGLRFDELVVCIDISDIQDEAMYYELDEATGTVKARRAGLMRELDPGAEAPAPALLRPREANWLRDNTMLLHWLGSTILDLARPGRKIPIDGDRAAWTYDPRLFDEFGREGLDLAVRHMDLLLDLCRSRGIGVTAVIYPWPSQIARREIDNPHVRRWTAWAREHQVRLVDLFPSFINDRDPGRVLGDYFIDWDVHWNREGNRFVAERLLAELRSAAGPGPQTTR